MLADVHAYKLRGLREMPALTQTDIAEALAISLKRVSEIECGRVDRTTLCRYAGAVGGTLRVEVQVGGGTRSLELRPFKARWSDRLHAFRGDG